jgi:hypothetical protein
MSDDRQRVSRGQYEIEQQDRYRAMVNSGISMGQAFDESWAYMRRWYVVEETTGGIVAGLAPADGPTSPSLPTSQTASGFKVPSLLSVAWMGIKLALRKDEVMNFSWLKAVGKGLKAVAIAAGAAGIAALITPDTAHAFSSIPVFGGMVGTAVIAGLTALLNWYKVVTAPPAQ